jgi:hypothetical protein
VRKTLCPEVLEVEQSDGIVAWAGKQHRPELTGRELTAQWAAMRDHYLAKPAMRSDWAATFRNWLRSDYFTPKYKPAGAAQPPVYVSPTTRPPALAKEEVAKIMEEQRALREKVMPKRMASADVSAKGVHNA